MGRTDTRIAARTAGRSSVATQPRMTQAPDAGVRAYLDDIDRYPLLSAEQERELGERARRGDKAARQQLITCNLRLVVSIAKSYRPHHLSLLDLIGEGNVGLCQAVDRYRPRTSSRFATYAGWWIRKAISAALAERDSVVHLPRHLAIIRNRVQRAIAASLPRGLTVEELCVAANVTVGQLRLLAKAPMGIVSLDAPMHERDAAGDVPATLGETLHALEEGPEDALDATDDRARVLALLREHLTRREALVLALRLQLVDLPGHESDIPPTQRDIARFLGVTHQSVSLWEASAREKLRNAIQRGPDGSLVVIHTPPTPTVDIAEPEHYTQAALFGAA